MKTSSSAIQPARQKSAAPPPPPEPAGERPRAWTRFWFSPADPVALHILRVLAGLLFLAWLLPFAGHLDAVFGHQGWFDEQAYADAVRLSRGLGEPARSLMQPGWTVLDACGSDPTALRVFYGVSLAVLLLFTLGVYPRLTAVLTWLVVGSFTANPHLEYEGDALLLILALYLMVGYVLTGQREPGLSWSARLLGPRLAWPLGRLLGGARGEAWPSVGANLAVRLLQVHFAIVMVVSGLHKLQFGDWWAGVALWFPLHPPFETKFADIVAQRGSANLILTGLNIAGYAVLFWQIGFPLFAWRPRWRPVLLIGGLLGALGTMFLYRLPVLGPALFLGCLSFVTPQEWQRLFALLGRLPGLRTDEAAAPQREESASLVTAGQR